MRVSGYLEWRREKVFLEKWERDWREERRVGNMSEKTGEKDPTHEDRQIRITVWKRAYSGNIFGTP